MAESGLANDPTCLRMRKQDFVPNKIWDAKLPFIKLQIEGQDRYALIDSGSETNFLNFFDVDITNTSFIKISIKLICPSVLDESAVIGQICVKVIWNDFANRSHHFNLNGYVFAEEIERNSILGIDFLQQRNLIIDINSRIIYTEGLIFLYMVLGINKIHKFHSN